MYDSRWYRHVGIDGILEYDFQHECDTNRGADHDFIAGIHSMEGLDDSMLWFPSPGITPEMPDTVFKAIHVLAQTLSK